MIFFFSFSRCTPGLWKGASWRARASGAAAGTPSWTLPCSPAGSRCTYRRRIPPRGRRWPPRQGGGQPPIVWLAREKRNSRDYDHNNVCCYHTSFDPLDGWFSGHWLLGHLDDGGHAHFVHLIRVGGRGDATATTTSATSITYLTIGAFNLRKKQERLV